MKAKTKDFSFTRFFNPQKSPRTQLHINKDSGLPDGFDYFPKHFKQKGKVVWDSARKGTYVKERHGELC